MHLIAMMFISLSPKLASKKDRKKKKLFTLSRLSNLETTITVLLKVGSISRMASNHNDEHHSTLLCWRNTRILWGGLANDLTIERISSGVFSGSPFFAYQKFFKTTYITFNWRLIVFKLKIIFLVSKTYYNQ